MDGGLLIYVVLLGVEDHGSLLWWIGKVTVWVVRYIGKIVWLVQILRFQKHMFLQLNLCLSSFGAWTVTYLLLLKRVIPWTVLKFKLLVLVFRSFLLVKILLVRPVKIQWSTKFKLFVRFKWFLLVSRIFQIWTHLRILIKTASISINSGLGLANRTSLFTNRVLLVNFLDGFFSSLPHFLLVRVFKCCYSVLNQIVVVLHS